MALYQIRLKGHLDRYQRLWREDFSVYLHTNGETLLTGNISDQAALFGVLLRIRDLGIPLVSVNMISPDGPKSRK